MPATQSPAARSFQREGLAAGAGAGRSILNNANIFISGDVVIKFNEAAMASTDDITLAVVA